ncbi:nucleic-acid-binding protein from transposon X-element [Nephila pilipes]|uniref:Nucleic-acid-binding protein from transposon X-element n=1 Tax=Nephila pilipes TaxID=299642 RepID=A0A8X6MRC8_NEPPI|nr:nucleic-acid-binding protein from transposon X-element [Nephila pilipes]
MCSTCPPPQGTSVTNPATAECRMSGNIFRPIYWTNRILTSSALCSSFLQYVYLCFPSEKTVEDPTNNITEDVTLPPPRKQYAPPITIDNIQDSTPLLKKLKEITKINLTGKLIGSSLQVYLQTPAAYHQIRRFINQKNLQHYTYHLPEDRLSRAVILGMPTDIPVQEILKDLDNRNIHADECHILTNKHNNPAIHLFFFTLKRNYDNKEIFNLTEICSLKIKEALRKKLGPAQCHICKGFFHNSRFCTCSPKCVICGKNHLSKDCMKHFEISPICCHCNGDHSNYLQCLMNPLNCPTKVGKKEQTEERIRLKTKTINPHQPPSLPHRCNLLRPSCCHPVVPIRISNNSINKNLRKRSAEPSLSNNMTKPNDVQQIPSRAPKALSKTDDDGFIAPSKATKNNTSKKRGWYCIGKSGNALALLDVLMDVEFFCCVINFFDIGDPWVACNSF